MSAETRLFVLLFALVLITVTIIANAEPVPVPVALITKKKAINFFKKQLKKNIYEPAKKQVMPIITAITNTFAEGLKNATSTAIMKGRDAFVKMEKAKQEEKAKQIKNEDYDRDTSYDPSFD